MKKHIKDIRLANNAGISMPVCQSQTKYLDLEKSRYSFTHKTKNATCKHCIRMYPKRYPWTQ